MGCALCIGGGVGGAGDGCRGVGGEGRAGAGRWVLEEEAGTGVRSVCMCGRIAGRRLEAGEGGGGG